MQETKKRTSYKRLPVLPLRGMVLLPNTVLHFDVARPKSMAALEEAMKGSRELLIVTQPDASIEDPQFNEVSHIGTVAFIKQILNMPDNVIRVSVEGLRRGIMLSLESDMPFWLAKFGETRSYLMRGTTKKEVEQLAATLRSVFQKYCEASQRLSAESIATLMSTPDPADLADAIAANTLSRLEDRLLIEECVNVKQRLETLCAILMRETDIAITEKAIQERVKVLIDKNQKDFFLREQIHAIEEELGDGDDNEIEEYRQRLAATPVNEEARKKAEKELDRISRMVPGTPEIAISTTYVDWILDLPWGKETEDNLHLKQARKILDEDHYGLDKVKERIIEYLAVLSVKQNMKGPILCFVGPPGVGKTSIVRSIAKATGREFVQMSLGGVQDEAEIRGHRRTYLGAIPGRIISGIKQCGVMNPVFLFDEIDKMGSDFKGDPASAMLEVLDSEQNHAFRDHYMDIPFDLSHVMFITTANSEENIPPALRDRMEIIEVPSYTEPEKLKIAKKHLLPKQIAAHGLAAGSVKISDKVLSQIIDSYTREAGVRTLERTIASVVRKATVEMLDAHTSSVTVTPDKLTKYLGGVIYLREGGENKDLVGVVNGLAFTELGGELLKIECTIMKGTGNLLLTGKLGDVMQESAKAALSWIRANGDIWNIPASFFKENDIHIHVPEGAVPKDGPSAGVTLCTALLSSITRTPVRCDLAMTGEISLRGRVLPIGGLREKLMAAYRAKLTTVLIPKENVKDLEDIAPEVRKALKCIPVSTLEEVLVEAIPQKPIYAMPGEKAEAPVLAVPIPPQAPGLPANYRGI